MTTGGHSSWDGCKTRWGIKWGGFFFFYSLPPPPVMATTAMVSHGILNSYAFCRHRRNRTGGQHTTCTRTPATKPRRVLRGAVAETQTALPGRPKGGRWRGVLHKMEATGKGGDKWAFHWGRGGGRGSSTGFGWPLCHLAFFMGCVFPASHHPQTSPHPAPP